MNTLQENTTVNVMDDVQAGGITCPNCAAANKTDAKFCSECGLSFRPTSNVPQVMIVPSQQPTYAYAPAPTYTYAGEPKSRTTAGIFALLLGGIGVHKFYLGDIGMGVLYIIFCWTFIPAIVALIEGIIYLTMTDEAFQAKYARR